MTGKRGERKGKAGAGARSGKLRVKKETLKDLDVRRKAGKVRGGTPIIERGTNCILCSLSCQPLNIK